MTTAHRIHNTIYRGSKILADPGNGGTITVTEDLQLCELVSAGASETRILANPTKPGIRFVVRHLTDGGDITITASNGLNTEGETNALMSEAGDLLSLISVTLVADTSYRWETLVNTATVLASATPSATPSATKSSTPSSTPSATKSSTPSATPSNTPSSTPSATVSSTPSSTPSNTP